jgi:hypothetical protein
MEQGGSHPQPLRSAAGETLRADDAQQAERLPLIRQN